MPRSKRSADFDIRLIKAVQSDPAEFCRHYLGIDLWAKQVEILESVRDNETTAVAAAHSLSKSHTAAAAAIWFAVAYPNSLSIVTAPTHRQAIDIVFRQVRVFAQKLKADGFWSDEVRILKDSVELDEQWRIIAFATQDNDSIKFSGFKPAQGGGGCLIITDEAAAVSDDIFIGVDGVLSGGDPPRLLMISNPVSQTGRFRQAFKRNAGEQSIYVGAFESPNFVALGIDSPRALEQYSVHQLKEKEKGLKRRYLIKPSWALDKMKRWGGPENPLFVARVSGRFPSTSFNMLITLADIDAAMARQFEEIDRRRPIYAFDIARMGGDLNVGYKAYQQADGRLAVDDKNWVWSGLDLTETAERIARIVALEAGEVAIDCGGLGVGVFDMLQNNYGLDCIEVKPAGAAFAPEEWANQRSELYGELAKLLRSGKICLPEDEDLRAELAYLPYGFAKSKDGRQVIRLDSKDDIKKVAGKSPDRADALSYLVMAADCFGHSDIEPITGGKYSDKGWNSSPWRRRDRALKRFKESGFYDDGGHRRAAIERKFKEEMEAL